MVRFPRKRSLLRHPQPENISEDISQPPSSSDVVVLTNLPYFGVTSSVNNDLDQYSICSSSSIGSSSTNLRQRRFRVPMRVPQFHRRRRPSLHQPPSSSDSVVSLPPPSNHIYHNATTTTTTTTTHSQHPLQLHLSPPGSIITPKQQSHLQLLPWRKQNPVSRGKKQNDSTITEPSTTSCSLINDETIIHHRSIPKKKMMMKIPPPIHTGFNTTAATVIDEIENRLEHNIQMNSIIPTSTKPERPTVVVTPNHNRNDDDDDDDDDGDKNLMIATPTHPNHTDSLALLLPPQITTPAPHIVVPISPENDVIDHLLLVTHKENERQSLLLQHHHHHHHSRFDNDVAATVVMTPSSIESKQVMNIVTPEQFDDCMDDNHTDLQQQQQQQQQHDVDSCGDDVVVAVTTTPVVEHNVSFTRKIHQGFYLDAIMKRNNERPFHNSHVDYWDNTTTMNRLSPSSVPSLLQESQCLKLSNLYTTIPNLSSNPWTIGCSM